MSFFPPHTSTSGNKLVFWQVWKSVVLNSVHLCRQYIWFLRLREKPLHCCDKRSCQQHSDKHSYCGLNTFLCFLSGRHKIKGTCDLKFRVCGSCFWILVFLYTCRSFSAHIQTCFSSVSVESLLFDSILSQGSRYFGLMIKFAFLIKALGIFLGLLGQSQTHHRRHHRGSTL